MFNIENIIEITSRTILNYNKNSAFDIVKLEKPTQLTSLRQNTKAKTSNNLR